MGLPLRLMDSSLSMVARYSTSSIFAILFFSKSKHLMVGWNIRSDSELIWLKATKRYSNDEKLLSPEISTRLPQRIDSYFRLHHPVPSCRSDQMLLWQMCNDFSPVSTLRSRLEGGLNSTYFASIAPTVWAYIWEIASEDWRQGNQHSPKNTALCLISSFVPAVVSSLASCSALARKDCLTSASCSYPLRPFLMRRKLSMALQEELVQLVAGVCIFLCSFYCQLLQACNQPAQVSLSMTFSSRESRPRFSQLIFQKKIIGNKIIEEENKCSIG